jgi:hypothetical protein
MLQYIADFGGEIVKVMGSLDRQQWFFVFVGVVVLGFLCMRGFGSRTNY